MIQRNWNWKDRDGNENTNLRQLARMGSVDLAESAGTARARGTLARIAGGDASSIEIRLPPGGSGGSVVLVDSASEEADREFERANLALRELGQGEWDEDDSPFADGSPEEDEDDEDEGDEDDDYDLDEDEDDEDEDDDDDDDSDIDTETLVIDPCEEFQPYCGHCGGTGSSDVGGVCVCASCKGTGNARWEG